MISNEKMSMSIDWFKKKEKDGNDSNKPRVKLFDAVNNAIAKNRKI